MGEIWSVLRQSSILSKKSSAHFPLKPSNEGFGGKRELGILRKIELCQKRFKFRMQFCLGVLNNVLHVFCPEACFLFEILRMRKNTFFRGHPLETFC